MARYYDKEEKKGGMISSKKNDFANMPQEVKHVSYPMASEGCPGGYRDNLEGIDAYAKENHRIVAKQKRSPANPS